MARRSEHSLEEIKEMVLSVSETIVIEEGFAELKVRRVAMDIGYTVGSIYMVFDNMADLFMHVKGRTLDDIANQLKQNVDNESAEKAIKQLAKSYLAYASENLNRWNMIFEHRLAENEQVPEWFQTKIDSVFSLIESQFNRLTSTYSEEKNKLAARSLWSGIHGICILSLSGKIDLLGTNHTEDAVELLVDNFIKGWVSNS
jgi:AcrR family transcriptional regulator